MTYESLRAYTTEIEPTRPYRSFFEWSANLPLQKDAIQESLRFNPSPETVNIVGLANITNLIQIAESVSSDPSRVVVFDAARETNLLLSFYFENILGITPIQKDQVTTNWQIPPNTILPVLSHEPCKVQSATEISLVKRWYEEIPEEQHYDADIIFVDKTLMWASNPIGLLNALAFQSSKTPDRKIVLSIYQNYPILIHRLLGGHRIGGLRKTDKASYSGQEIYPGMIATITDILRETEEPLWQVERPGRLYAYPKRTNSFTHWIPDFDPETVDFSLPIYTRQFGQMSLTEEAIEELLSGQREFWLSDDLMLYAFKTSPQDKQYLIGAFDIVDAIIRPDQIDPNKARSMLARKHYASNI